MTPGYISGVPIPGPVETSYQNKCRARRVLTHPSSPSFSMRKGMLWFSIEDRTSSAGQPKAPGSSGGETSSTGPSSSASKNSGVENFGDIATSPAEAAATATASNEGSSNEEVLEMYRGEIEDLRRQLRESQEVRHREELAQREIMELRRQLQRTEKASHAPVPAEGVATNSIDTEAVRNALKYLDRVIQRMSSKSRARTKANRSMRHSEDDTKQAPGGNNIVEATPIRANKKVVELEFCPTLHQKVSTDTEDGSEGSWRPAGAIKRLVDDMSSVATSSLPGIEGSGTSSIPFGQSSIISSIYGTANGDTSSVSASSWQPTAAMAALVAGMADDSTVNTWLTAGDDDFDDMHTCMSTLTSPTNARSRGTGSSANKTSINVSKDDTAVVISQLYQIQSLLLAILKDKEATTKAGVMHHNEDKVSPSIEPIPSRSKSIANVWENQLDNNDINKRNDQDDEKRNDKQKKSDNQIRKQLTKEDAEQIISSLAALF